MLDRVKRFQVATKTRTDLSGGLFLYFEQDGKIFVANPVDLQFSETNPPGSVVGPTFRFNNPDDADEFLRACAAEAARRGLISTKQPEVDAIRAHLEDMRTLAMGKKSR